MPMYRTPTTQELEDHFFGSGAFQYGWFIATGYDHFPVTLIHVNPDTGYEVINDGEDDFPSRILVTEEVFIDGIKKYAVQHPTKYFDNLIEDMDAADVDNVLQLIMFGEIRYS